LSTQPVLVLHFFLKKREKNATDTFFSVPCATQDLHWANLVGGLSSSLPPSKRSPCCCCGGLVGVYSSVRSHWPNQVRSQTHQRAQLRFLSTFHPWRRRALGSGERLRRRRLCRASRSRFPPSRHLLRRPQSWRRLPSRSPPAAPPWTSWPSPRRRSIGHLLFSIPNAIAGAPRLTWLWQCGVCGLVCNHDVCSWYSCAVVKRAQRTMCSLNCS
jgi:hypothetical protein